MNDKTLCTFAALIFMSTSCSDDGSNSQTPERDAGVDVGASADSGAAVDAGKDGSMENDMGVEAEFFADFELRSLFVDETIPQINFLINYTGTNNGPDPVVIESCQWSVSRDSDGSTIAAGEIPFCEDCNPIDSGETASDANPLDDLMPGDNPGTVAATFTLTCLPTGLYEDTDPSNNTVTESFTY